jgi:hypothetical protein
MTRVAADFRARKPIDIAVSLIIAFFILFSLVQIFPNYARGVELPDDLPDGEYIAPALFF